MLNRAIRLDGRDSRLPRDTRAHEKRRPIRLSDSTRTKVCTRCSGINMTPTQCIYVWPVYLSHRFETEFDLHTCTYLFSKSIHFNNTTELNNVLLSSNKYYMKPQYIKSYHYLF